MRARIAAHHRAAHRQRASSGCGRREKTGARCKKWQSVNTFWAWPQDIHVISGPGPRAATVYFWPAVLHQRELTSPACLPTETAAPYFTEGDCCIFPSFSAPVFFTMGGAMGKSGEEGAEGAAFDVRVRRRFASPYRRSLTAVQISTRLFDELEGRRPPAARKSRSSRLPKPDAQETHAARCAESL